jgi:hypothetical protein
LLVISTDKAESLFVCTLYKFTFLNQSEPNFAHISPIVWKRPKGMYGPKMFIFYLLDLLHWEQVLNPWHEMAAGASHLRQRYIPDSCWC